MSTHPVSAPTVAGPCLTCGFEGRFEDFYADARGTLLRCPSCSLVFQHPPPSADTLANAYYQDEDFARALLAELRPWTVEQAERKREVLTRVAGPGAPRGRVLDVGCSSGAWLEVAAGAGAVATGVEIGQAVAAGARARGLDVRTGTLEDVRDELQPDFDLITFWDVLEHLPDPGVELGLAFALLRPGGLLAATVPNVEGWYPRLTRRLFASTLGIWEYPELPVHLFDFSPATARRLLERHEFEVVGTRTFPLPFGFYRSTSLSPERLGAGRRGRLTGWAFDVLHRVVYPIADLADRSNWLMIVARRPHARG